MKLGILNCEILPDIARARLRYQLENNLSDMDTSKVLFHTHIQSGKRFLQPWDAALASLSFISIHDDQVKCKHYDVQDLTEKNLIATLDDLTRNHHELYFWDHGRDMKALLRFRSVLDGIQIKGDQLKAIEYYFGIKPGDIDLDLMVRNFGYSLESLADDETNWYQVHAHGYEVLAQRSRQHTIAASRLMLHYLLSSMQIDTEQFEQLHKRLDALWV